MGSRICLLVHGIDTSAMGDEVDLEDLLSVLSPEEVAALVDEMAADPDDKHMPASVRTAYRCEKEPTGELNRDSLINCINEIALNTPDQEEKVKYEAGMKRGKEYVPVYNEAQMADMDKAEAGQVKLEPDAPNETNAKEVLEKLKSNDRDCKDVNLNNLGGISESEFCDIFNTLRNNDNITKFSACNVDLSDFAVETLCAALDQNDSLKSLSIENNRVSPDALADLFEAAASPNNGLLEVRVAAQQQEKMGQRVEERIAAAICKNPRIMKCGIQLEFKEIVQRVSKHMISNLDKLRVTRLKDGVAPGAGVKWTAARTLD